MEAETFTRLCHSSLLNVTSELKDVGYRHPSLASFLSPHVSTFCYLMSLCVTRYPSPSPYLRIESNQILEVANTMKLNLYHLFPFPLRNEFPIPPLPPLPSSHPGQLCSFDRRVRGMEGGGEWTMERRKGNGEEVERLPFDDGQQVNSGMYTLVVLHSQRRPYSPH